MGDNEEKEIIEKEDIKKDSDNNFNLEDFLKRDDVQKEIQKVADKRVTQALATAKAKWEADAEHEKTEAEKLSKMTETQKEQYQFKKEKEEFEKTKREFERKSLILETAKQMNSAGLPDLADFITGKDAEETAENIKKVTDILGVWKQNALNDALRGGEQKDTNKTHKSYTREDIKKMSRKEINEAWAKGLINLKD